jgi:hypothetical protein
MWAAESSLICSVPSTREKFYTSAAIDDVYDPAEIRVADLDS